MTLIEVIFMCIKFYIMQGKTHSFYLMLRECSCSCYWILWAFHKQESIQIVSLFPGAACFTPVAAAPGMCLLPDFLLQTILNLIILTWQSLRGNLNESIKHLCWLPGVFLTRNQSATDNMITASEVSQHPRDSLQAQLRPYQEECNPGEAAGEQTLSSLTTRSLVQCLIPPLLKTRFSKMMNYCFPSNSFALETLTISQIALSAWKDCSEHRGMYPTFEPCCATGHDGGTGHACVETGGKLDSHSGKVSWAQHLVPGVLSICVGWGKSPSKLTDPDRITCRPQMEETPIPHVHGIITQVHSLLEQERTVSMVRRSLPPWQTASCKSFPLPKKNKVGKRGRAQLKLNCAIKRFSTTNRLTSDSAIELEQYERLQNAVWKGNKKQWSHKEPSPRQEGPPDSPCPASAHAEKVQERWFCFKVKSF